MKKFSALFRSVVNCFRTRRTQPEHSITPEQFRQMLQQTFADREQARALLKNLVGTVFPIQGGLACGTQTLGQIAKFCDSSGSLDDSAITQSGSNVGIGASSPAATLHVQLPTLSGAHTNRNATIFTDLYNSGSNGQDLALNTLTTGTDYAGWNLSSDWGGRLSFGVWPASSYNTTPNEYLSILSGGNVGIGTNGPTERLQVNGNVILTGQTTHAVVASGTATSGRFGQDAIGAFVSSDTSGAAVRFLTNNGSLNEWMRITSAGNVGVGTTSPSQKLQISGGSVKLDNNTGVIFRNAANSADDTVLSYTTADNTQLVSSGGNVQLFALSAGGVIGFYTNGTNQRAVIDAAGKVGIGNASPASLLQVGSGSVAGGALGGVNVSLGTSTYVTASDGTSTVFMGSDAISGGEKGIVGTLTNHDLVLRTNNTERARLTAAGVFSIPNLNQIVFLKPSGGDDMTQIQNAINSLPANGGIIYLTPGTYNISSTLTITSNGVKIRGYGGTEVSSTSPATLLSWTASNGGPVIRVGVSGTSAISRDAEISDLTIDGGGSGGALIGLELDQVLHSKFIAVHVGNMRDRDGFGNNPSTGIHLTTTGSNDCAWNLFENCVVDAASQALVLSGSTPTGHNVDHNTFIGLTLLFHATSLGSGSKLGDDLGDAGILLGNCDNNCFLRTFLYRNGSLGTGVLCVMGDHDSGDGVLLARSNYFYHLQVTNTSGSSYGFKVIQANSASAAANSKNMVFGYDLSNGQGQPVAFDYTGTSVAPGNFMFWTDSAGNIHGGAIV